VNSTRINELLEETWIINNKNQKLKDTMNVNGAYPRWIISGNLTKNILNQETRSIISTIHIGDSRYEVDLNVAIGFPKDVLKDDQIINSLEFYNYFGYYISPLEAFE
jgi:hypothetical protein